MKGFKIKNLIIIGSTIILLGIIIPLLQLSNSESVFTSSEIKSEGNVSNEKLAWGIKRNSNHEQPDVGKKNREILEENDGICLGNSQEKIIYLTFDEGYEAGFTNQILDILKENNVKATFFITAHYLNSATELVERMINEGHIVGNHTPNFLMSENDIEVKC